MTVSLRRLMVLCVVLALAWSGLPSPAARAQDGGDTTIQYNEPVIVTLPAGQSVTRTFSALTGDRFELRLSPLAQFTYTAVLLDPAQNATPLTPGPDGNTVFTVESVVQGGTFSLVLQATAGSGDMLVQLIGQVVQPVALQIGETSVDLTTIPQRFSLVPPADAADTLLTINSVPPAEPPVPFLPALTLTDQQTGEVVLSLTAGFLPQVSVILPAQRAFLLSLDPGETPLQLMLIWGPAPGAPQANATGPCQVTFSGAVNIRSGPGTVYDPPIGAGNPGLTLSVVGRNQPGDWWQVSFNGQLGWVSNRIPSVTTLGDCSAIPVASAPPPPLTRTPTPTASPTGPTFTPSASPTITLTPSITNTPGGPTETPTWTPSWTPTQEPTWTPSWTPTP